jgi:CRISPR-associated protein (TIGR02710 family)
VNQHTLLICTVGGTPEPIVAALKHWKPARIRFVVTPETRPSIEGQIRPLAQAEGLDFDPGRYDVLELSDGQDFAGCLRELRELTPVIQEWLNRGDQYQGEPYQVVVDFTGGTKCMSAALALHARRWRCVFSYIGGKARTKEGVGIVVSGKEQVLHAYNPWEALGFQAVERFAALFDQQAFAAAAILADSAIRNMTDPSRKRELNALKLLAEAYDAWDRFDHKEAVAKLGDVAKYENDLHAVLGPTKSGQVCDGIAKNCRYLQQLVETSSPNKLHVMDLLANARRRKEEGRLDDAVARLYRAIEAVAQLALAERHQITDTKRVPLASVPEPLRSQWASRAQEGMIFLGLQDAYALLHALGDALGDKFMQLQLHDRERSPLVARNQSILAHGWQRVSENVFNRLWGAALQLAETSESDLPSFPRLGS